MTSQPSRGRADPPDAAAVPLDKRDGMAVPCAPVVGGVQRVLLAALAVLFLALAVVGAILPGMPSTVFVLAAAWAAARSSPRLHAWLYRSALFGPGLRNWRDGRKVSRRAKHAAGLSMAVCAAIMLWTVPQSWLVWPAIGCMAAVLAWLWRRPEPDDSGRARGRRPG